MPSRPPAVARVLERMTGTIRRHSLVEPGQLVLVGVSGGADSLCLLHGLHALRRLLRIRLGVVHVDHAARRGSEADAAYVSRVAARLGVPSTVGRVTGRRPRGAAPEAWLRGERYRLFDEALSQAGADLVATAHTADDQAETVLLALVRGGGLDAMAGIPPARDRVIRPLLDVTRAETEAFCRALRLRPRQDPTNLDRRYLRNAIRHGVMPALASATGRDVVATMSRTAEGLREDASFLDHAAEAAARRVVRRGRHSKGTGSAADGERLLAAGPLDRLAYPIASRVVATVLREMAGPEVLARAHVDAVLDLARGRPGRRADLPALKAVREGAYVRLVRTPHPDDPASP